MSKKGVFILVLALFVVLFSFSSNAIPDFLLTENCDFGYNFACFQGSFKINSSEDNTIMFKLRNNINSVVFVDSIEAKTTSPGVKCRYVTINGKHFPSGEEFRWEKDESHLIVINCINGSSLSVGSREKIEFKFNWYSVSAGDSFKKNGMGHFTKTVYGVRSVEDKTFTHFYLVISGIFLGVFLVVLLYYIKIKFYLTISKKSYRFLSIFISMVATMLYVSVLFFFLSPGISDIVSKIVTVLFAILSVYLFKKTPIELEEIIDLAIVFVSYLFFGGITYFLYINAI